MPDRDLSGRWSGFYTAHDDERPISAEFEQVGEILRGTMNDQKVDFDTSVAELALAEGLAPGTDEQIVEKVRALCPDAPPLPVRAEFHLPSESTLEGEVHDRTVEFLKRYQGRHFVGYRVGTLRVGLAGEDREVRYRGRLSEDGRRIEGRWNLLGGDSYDLFPLRTEGDFVLRREPW